MVYWQLKEKACYICAGCHAGQRALREQLQGKSFLLFFDDIDMGNLQKFLLGDSGWPELGMGSFVILTSRNKRALIDASCEKNILNVRTLSPGAALKLFLSKAKRIPSDVRNATVSAIVERCCGLPLSLKAS